MGFPAGSVVKNLPAHEGDAGAIPEWGRYPGGGNVDPLQYSCLEKSMGRGAWRATVHGVARVGHNLETKPPPWRSKWQPTPVFLPGKVHGQRSLEGCSPWGYITEDACMRRVKGDGLVAINW